MKKFVIAATIAAGALTMSACSSNGDSEVVVETKSGDVTKEEFYEALKNKYGEGILQQLVMKEVLSGKYEVSDEAVQKEVDKLKEQYGDQFEMVLQQSGFKDVEDFKETIRLSLLQEKAAMEDMDISEKEMKDYYEKMKTEVKASHILVKDKETAQKVMEELENGAEFSELAKEYSTDTATAKKGGDLGFFSAGEMTPKFENAAYALKKGEVSEPVKTEFGYHIIKKTDERKAEDVGSFEEEKDDIKRQIVSKKIDQQKLQKKMDKLMKEAEIDVKIEEYKNLFEQKKQPAEGGNSGNGSGSGNEGKSEGESDAQG
ncbi:peptidylprolyl isomerase [Thalassobacillus pellis]|uniref:peptidylprolyl isomerase n=1 Tax=Thalassobacillus pellis TaxID=748008 RepID=UPI001960168F|nr:peptidylprolyl isomerase [Thalassobacillus pellis]MBM7554129.1 foldase protein PrsA [Thalassobacillus pellis]